MTEPELSESEKQKSRLLALDQFRAMMEQLQASPEVLPYMSPAEIAEEIRLMHAERRAIFRNQMQELVPKTLNHFRKLTSGEPYRFDYWREDSSGSTCMYYWFFSRDGTKRREKRVVVSEIESAWVHLRNFGCFDRNVYKVRCPKSLSSGPCGFAVMGRIFEALGLATYSGNKRGFLRVDSTKPPTERPTSASA